MSGNDSTQVDQVDLFSQALFMLDEVNKDVEVWSCRYLHISISLFRVFLLSLTSVTVTYAISILSSTKK